MDIDNSTAERVNDYGPLMPRKEPLQQRSRMMVQAITDACRVILRKQGLQGLTVHDLEAESGVGKGSIYQYFPTLEAVIARVFQEDLQAHHQQWDSRLQLAVGIADRADILRIIIESTISSHQQLLRLSQEFYCRYSDFFDIEKYYDDLYRDGAARELLEKLLVDPSQRLVSDGELSIQVTIFMSAIEAACRKALVDSPEVFDDPVFFESLYRMSLGVFNLSACPDTGP